LTFQPDSSSKTAAAASSPPETFDVVVASTGQVIPVAAHETVLEALESAGYDVPWLCRAGYCGTCVTEVLDGTPDNRGTALDDTGRPCSMTVCVSRSKSPRITLSL
jgi:vanillate O-demethylase ferredoxin subunit